MKKLLAVMLCLMSSAVVLAEDNQDVVSKAADAVATLHDSMLDPASFVLDSVYVTKANKKGEVDLCFEYRAHNRMGGYSQGLALVEKGKLNTYIPNADGYATWYNTGFSAPCKTKNLDRDITKEVMKVAPTLYKKDK